MDPTSPDPAALRAALLAAIRRAFVQPQPCCYETLTVRDVQPTAAGGWRAAFDYTFDFDNYSQYDKSVDFSGTAELGPHADGGWTVGGSMTPTRIGDACPRVPPVVPLDASGA